MTPAYECAINPRDTNMTYAWLMRFTEGASTILDIGCSTGFFSRQLKARGQYVIGIEEDPLAAELAVAICERVICGDIEAVETQARVTEVFDAVVLGDVLEHLRDPQGLLAYIRQHWSADGGSVAFSAPNAGHWIFRREVLLGRFPYRSQGLFDPTHLRFFTQDSVRQMVKGTGYCILDLGYTVNYDSSYDLSYTGEAVTFAMMKPLYLYRYSRAVLLRWEKFLARIWPRMFAYQFVFKIAPAGND